MAVFTDQTWADSDEVTSQRLQAMQDNTVWLKDNLILGDINYKVGANGEQPFGRPGGTSHKAMRIDGIYVPFSSNGASTPYVPVDIAYPANKYVMPPIISVTISQGQSVNYNAVVYQDADNNVARVTVYNADGYSTPMHGALNVIILGYTEN